MAFELSKDASFLEEIFTVPIDALSETIKQEPKSPKVTKRRSRNSLQKENAEATKKKSPEPRKSGRKPLVDLNEIKPPKKRVSNATEKSDPPKRKSTARASLPPPQPKVEKKGNLPKIIIYEDLIDKTKAQVKRNNRKSVTNLPKSQDGLVPAGRRSYVKSPKLVVSKARNVRRSLNDLPSITSNKKEKSPKSVKETKKTPTKPRVTKLKPGQPEFEQKLAKLIASFPNIDPEFIKMQFYKFNGSVSDVREFIKARQRANELSTRADLVRRLEVEKVQNKFLENFSVVDFLKTIPDPWEHFLKTERHKCFSYSEHSLHYLKNKYKKHYVKYIKEVLEKNKYSLYLTDKQLRRKNRSLKMRASNRSNNECDLGKPIVFNMQFIQEVAFIENEKKIMAHMKKVAKEEDKKFKEETEEEAETLLECEPCNDFSLLQDDVVNCTANHVFCEDCVVNSHFKNASTSTTELETKPDADSPLLLNDTVNDENALGDEKNSDCSETLLGVFLSVL